MAGTAGALEVDPSIPAYQKVSGVSGSIKSIGSDTLNNLMTLWAEGFSKQYPNVNIEIEGKGSGTAPPALIAGTAQFGPMSRPMKAAEVDNFEKKFGYKPTPMRTAVDALAVYVNRDNPIQCLSLAQIDVGVTGDLAKVPISMYGRNSASGTYGYFKEVALADGDYKDSVKEQPGSSAVVQGVASDKAGIGYSGVGYKTADVKFVPVSAKDGGTCYEPNSDNAYAGNYPITRFLYVYVNKNPNQPLDPVRAEFIKYVQSKQGQQGVIKDGFFPLPGKVVQDDHKTLGLTN
jgi:phosphate transport system substrate-binding protein